MYQPTDLKKGVVCQIDGKPYPRRRIWPKSYGSWRFDC